MRRHHVRARATGPGFPLTVVLCHTHHRAFTLYPPAYVPYARVPVAPVTPSGDVASEEPHQAKLQCFRGTAFEAAVDAAAGRAWPREHQGHGQRWWHTQQRWLELGLAVLGLEPTAGDSLRHRLAEALAVEALPLVELSRSLQGGAAGYRAQGQAVVAVLERLTPSSMLADRLLEAGHLAGRWGAPHRLITGSAGCASAMLLRCPFRAAGTTAARAPP